MANKIVQLVDKNSNNLYPVAGSVIDDAVSTGAISSQAVTTAKIANGAVTGVANDATAIGTAKLALNTVGTPNLRDKSVTSDKIDWTTIHGQGATRSLTAGEVYNFVISVDIPDGAFVAEAIPYVTGNAAAHCMISGSHRDFHFDTKQYNFYVKNTSNATQSWQGHVKIRYIKPS